MAGFIDAKQQTSTPTDDEAVAGFRPTTIAGGGNYGGIPPPAATQDAHHLPLPIPKRQVRAWSLVQEQEDPHPPVWHVHATRPRGLPAQARHKNEKKPVYFIPGISNSSKPASHQVPEEQPGSKPNSSRPVPLQQQKDELMDELKKKARQKVFRLIGEK